MVHLNRQKLLGLRILDDGASPLRAKISFTKGGPARLGAKEGEFKEMIDIRLGAKESVGKGL